MTVLSTVMAPALAAAALLAVAPIGTGCARRSVGRRPSSIRPGPGQGRPRGPRSRRRRGGRPAAVDPDALARAADVVARELRAGAAMGDALDRAVDSVDGPLGGALTAVRASVLAGERWGAALDGWAIDSGSDDVAVFVASAGLALETGGASASAFESCAAALRTRRALADEVRSLTAQVRASAAVLGGLPVVAVIGFSLLDARVGRFFVTSGPGVAVGFVGVGLTAAGSLWLRAQVRSVS